MTDITLVLTSCGRFDLLDKTLASIGPSILNSLSDKIIIDDSGREDARRYFDKYGDDWKIRLNGKNLAQPKSVDKAYAHVTTPYVFHCEDDWFFENFVSFEACVDILESDKSILQVTFRKDSPHPEFPQIFRSNKGFSYRKVVEGWRGEWWGFTYNPSLFRMSAYKEIGSYSGMNEQTISKRYHELGYKTACLSDEHYYHIGVGRGTNSHLKL